MWYIKRYIKQPAVNLSITPHHFGCTRLAHLKDNHGVVWLIGKKRKRKGNRILCNQDNHDKFNIPNHEDVKQIRTSRNIKKGFKNFTRFINSEDSVFSSSFQTKTRPALKQDDCFPFPDLLPFITKFKVVNNFLLLVKWWFCHKL